ncbi:hypothetical protein [Pararhodobacter zhoushanensis]|uniref:hypothetical protein n=1 Tax=Pararhodobacter zhoushanensis TaxID=2479545 RepID=UPI000F8D57F5|nr:hypothetical protein [Pararhodobacter zhoushanensis]
MSTAPATWRIILAAILDFFTIFAVGGYVIAKLTGNVTESGFSLSGMPAVMLFAVMIGYFVAGHYLGGTLWQRILRARR